MEFEDFSEDFNDLWTADYGETLKGPGDIFDLSYLLEGGQPTTPEVVLNDKLMTEASLGLVPQVVKSVIPVTYTLSIPIKSEHSYSLCRDRAQRKITGDFLGIDDECFPAVSISEAVRAQPLIHVSKKIINSDDLSVNIRDIDQLSSSDTMSCCDEAEFTDDFTIDDTTLSESCPGQLSSRNDKSPSGNEFMLSINSRLPENCFRNEISDSDLNKTSPSALTCSTNSSLPGFSFCNELRHMGVSNSSKSFNYSYQNTRNSLPFTIPISENSFLQSRERGGSFPPTPPSSSSSDNESFCTSPSRTPLYETLSPQYCHPMKKFSLKLLRTPISTPLISSQPKGATGALHLTEEEKRTLRSEGYPIPSKLPLTKSEEKSLKKIRRKIKNKISAQESRRKKKEYMDTLESKVEALETENEEYIKRITILQKNNSSLLQELKSLQSMVAGSEDRRLSDNDCSFNL